jgi:hypothetical protein
MTISETVLAIGSTLAHRAIKATLRADKLKLKLRGKGNLFFLSDVQVVFIAFTMNSPS